MTSSSPNELAIQLRSHFPHTPTSGQERLINAFSKFSNSKKAFEYLDKSFEKLKSYPVSFGKYYEFTGFDSKDVAFYENSLKTPDPSVSTPLNAGYLKFQEIL